MWNLRLDSDIRSKIFFMHIYNPQEYPNLLPSISLTSEEIRNLVSTYKLTFSRERNREVEWGIKLPMFVDAFYAYIIEKQTVPNQEESFKFYLQYNKAFFDSLNRPDLESGIMARAYRTIGYKVPNHLQYKIRYRRRHSPDGYYSKE